MQELALVGGKVVPFKEIDSAYLDRGVFFGDGVYEVVRSYDGRIFALQDHLQRFERSLDEIGMEGIDIAEIEGQIRRLYAESGIENAKIYFHMTRGCEPRSHMPGKGLEPTFFLTIQELHTGRDTKSGIQVATHPDWRWKRCDIKSLNLLPNVMARMYAEKKGCQEAILVDDQGEITEGAGSAFFVILAGSRELITRPLGPQILPSITRRIVTEIARKAGLTLIEKGLTPWQASHADEMFIAVTTDDIVPVVSFDGDTIGTGKPGHLTMELKQKFADYVHGQI